MFPKFQPITGLQVHIFGPNLMYVQLVWRLVPLIGRVLSSEQGSNASQTLLRLTAMWLDFQFSGTVAATPITSSRGLTPSRLFHTTGPCLLFIVLSHDKIHYYVWLVVVSRSDDITCDLFFELSAISGDWPSFSRSTPVHPRDRRCDSRCTTGIAAVYG